MDKVIQAILTQDAPLAAPLLLGYKLVSTTPEGITAGYIVETEAYSMEDPASHSYRGPTPRTAPMFEAAGTIYVYFTYGMHYCMNLVTGPKGHGQAVLIRALEPVDGIDLMSARRGQSNPLQLTNGPAKLTQALGVGIDLSGNTLHRGQISVESGIKPVATTTTTRVGISRAIDVPWRFYITGNAYISRP